MRAGCLQIRPADSSLRIVEPLGLLQPKVDVGVAPAEQVTNLEQTPAELFHGISVAELFDSR